MCVHNTGMVTVFCCHLSVCPQDRYCDRVLLSSVCVCTTQVWWPCFVVISVCVHKTGIVTVFYGHLYVCAQHRYGGRVLWSSLCVCPQDRYGDSVLLSSQCVSTRQVL